MVSSDVGYRLVVAVVLVGVVLVGGAAAQAGEPVWAAGTEAALERIVDGHNAAVGDAALGPAADLVRDQRVTLTVTAADGSVARYSFRTDAAARVVDFRAGPRDDATVRMFTDPATVERVADSPDRAAAFEAAVRAGDVRIEGVGLLNRVAWALLGLALWALASPLRAVVVVGAVLVGAGALVVAGTNVVGGGAVAAGSAGTSAVGGAGTSPTATGSATASTDAGAVEPTAERLAQTGGDVVTAGNSFGPVGLADHVLSFFERALFVVAIAKKLARRVRRSLGAAVVALLGWFGFARVDGDADGGDGSEAADGPTDDAGRPTIRRRGVPRRRRR